MSQKLPINPELAWESTKQIEWRKLNLHNLFLWLYSTLAITSLLRVEISLFLFFGRILIMSRIMAEFTIGSCQL